MTVIVVPPPAVVRQGVEKTDAAYVEKAKSIVGLAQEAGMRADARILDIGCGAARFLTGLLATYGSVKEYLGLDVRKTPIDWGREAFNNPAFGNIRFKQIDAFNARYYASGEPVTASSRLPIEDNSFDFVMLYSVFTHMTVDDTRTYLSEIARVLDANGRCLCNAFVEEGVPAWQENPEGYGDINWRGPLHCALFNKAVFEGLIEEAGLTTISSYRLFGLSFYTLAPR